MKNKLWLFAVPALMAFSAASAVEIDFYDQSYFSTSDNGYEYLGVLDIADNPGKYAGTGYESIASITGKTVFGYPIYQHNPFTFKYIGPGDSFTLDSFYFASGRGDQSVKISGYKGDELVDSIIIAATTTANAQPYNLSSWGSIDRLVINASGTGEGWALGGLNITAVPEPESYAMLLAGLAIVGAVARRRAASRA
jgi:hypothetical protein